MSGKDKEDKKSTATDDKKEKLPVVHPSEDFNLEAYVARYEGHTKIARLLFIAERYKEKQNQSYKMAIDALKHTKFTSIYRKVFETVGESLGTGYTYDSSWADSIDKKAQVTAEELETLLNNYKTNLIRKKIRTGHNAIGNHHYERGDFNPALRSYIRTQDYCTSADHIIEMCMNVIKVSIAMNHFLHVFNYVNKAEQTPGIADKKLVESQLKATAGLAFIENRKYKPAAYKLIQTSFDYGNQFSDVLSPQDIAIYGSVCALAEFDRGELKREVLDNANFKNYLELVPKVGQMLSDFYNSKYASSLAYLQVLKNDLQLDYHLHDHVETLYQKIRNKALVQYFSPYTSVDIVKMAQAFQCDVVDMEKELAKLIVEGVISARIDSHNKRLYSRAKDERRETFIKSVNNGEEFLRNSRAMLVRVNLIRAGMMVKPQKGMEKENRKKKK